MAAGLTARPTATGEKRRTLANHLPRPRAARYERYVPRREFNEAITVMRNILVILVMALLPGCSSVSTYKASSVDLSRSPAVFLRIQKDTENFSGNISQRLESLGFKATKDPSRADYYAEVEYATFFDVVHQTFKHFEIIL